MDEQLTLRSQAEDVRIDFIIRTDLEMCCTFAGIVETGYIMGQQRRPELTLAEAERGYSTLLRLLSEWKTITAEVAIELQSKLQDVRERLDGLQRLG